MANEQHKYIENPLENGISNKILEMLPMLLLMNQKELRRLIMIQVTENSRNNRIAIEFWNCIKEIAIKR